MNDYNNKKIQLHKEFKKYNEITKSKFEFNKRKMIKNP